MKERGMIFNAEMVRALLDGGKTQTRRPVSGKLTEVFDWLGGDSSEDEEILSEISICNVSDIDRLNEETGKTYKYNGMLACNAEYPEEGYEEITCPFGQVGDRIWVRETFGMEVKSLGGTPHEQLVYKADKPDAVRCYDSNGIEMPMKWKPSIRMPRLASRITLEITNTRVERVQDISEQDAIAEGVAPNCAMLDHTNCDHQNEWMLYGKNDSFDGFPAFSAKESYASLWNSLYGEDAWNRNDWVWVIEFKRIQPQQVAA